MLHRVKRCQARRAEKCYIGLLKSKICKNPKCWINFEGQKDEPHSYWGGHFLTYNAAALVWNQDSARCFTVQCLKEAELAVLVRISIGNAHLVWLSISMGISAITSYITWKLNELQYLTRKWLQLCECVENHIYYIDIHIIIYWKIQWSYINIIEISLFQFTLKINFVYRLYLVWSI